MILGSQERQVELRVLDVEPPVPGVYAGGNVHVGVRVRLNDFSGAVTAGVLSESWRTFIRQLRLLERDRRGEATLVGISREELRVRLFALDRAGHMAVEGEMTAYFAAEHDPRATSLRFGAIEFDPTMLPGLLRELETVEAG
jgi:hypothetical protein